MTLSPRRVADTVWGATPLVVAAGALLLEVTWKSIEDAARLAALVGLLVLPPIGIVAVHGWSARTRRAVATPAVLAPLAVCFPWTAAPSGLGLAFGGFEFFLLWLTKYPTLGSLNHEVLLGILCVLGCAFLPWLSAVLLVRQPATRPVRAGLLGLALVAYIPVLIRLDSGLLLAVAFSPQPVPMWVAFGSVIRLAALLSMGAMWLWPNEERPRSLGNRRRPDERFDPSPSCEPADES